MNYRLRQNLSVEDSFRKIANEILEGALTDCRSTELIQHEIIHSLRKRCKRMRGLLRIVRPCIANIYENENQYYRDLARKLSISRDQQVAIETFTNIWKLSNNNYSLDKYDTLVKNIRERINQEKNLELINSFENEVSESIKRVKFWEVQSDGFTAISGGLRKTYRRGRNAMELVLRIPSTENYHEWRKRVKYHYYHLELLIPIWENVMEQYSEEVHRLSEMLGYDHDLCMLVELIKNKSELDIDKEIENIIIAAISSEQTKLRVEIENLGRKVYSEKSSQLVERIEGWWNTWKRN